MTSIVEQLENGVTVHQVTDGPLLVSNIYCERPYTSADSKRFLYARQTDEGGPGGVSEWEFVLCEFGTWEEQVVGCGELAAPVSYNNDYYYVRNAGGAAKEMVRLDLSSGESSVVFAYPDGIPRAGHPTASPDGRYLAYGVHLSYDPQMFGVELADTQTGERRVICEDPYLCNTHAQFEPAEGRKLLIQHNRGCEYSADGTRLALIGEEGGTLFILELDGTITRLNVGKPYTTPITGHQAWVGETQEIILTVRAEGDYSPEAGNANILLLREGEDCRPLAPGRRMVHIGTTHCGRYFHADGSKTQEIIVGSPKTGKTVLVCHSQTSYSAKGFGQQGHPHAYLSPDFRWVIFNSDRTDRPQVYAAALPPELLEGLDEG